MLPDNRIRFPVTKVDLENDVGLTGQTHDNYPAAGTQARADWMNLCLIGLLAQQSSYSEPSNYRDGTPWFDLNDGTLKIRFGGEWVHYAAVLSIAQDNDGASTKTLAQFYSEIQSALSGLSPEVVYNGSVTTNSTATIPIPESLRTYIASDSRAFVFVNGLLIDPRNTTIESGHTLILLTGLTLDSGDTFTVSIRRVSSATFYTQSVTVA